MKGGKIILLLLAVSILLVLSVILVRAQSTDSDSDGILDNVDVCSGTNSQTDLPIITQNKEYLGCSCSQIDELIKEKYCYDIFCEAGRPFSLQERTISSRKIFCESDYCIGNTLYAFPNISEVKCINGKEELFSCAPNITEPSDLCKQNIISQKKQNLSQPETEQKVLLGDKEKLMKRAYSLASQDISILNGLGIVDESLFLNRSSETIAALNVEKNTTKEVRNLGGASKEVTIRTITLTPNRYRSFKNVYVFEELPREYNIESKDVIPQQAVVMQEDGPVLLVWKLDNIKGKVTLSYQINNDFNGETNTLVVAREIHNSSWMWLFVPLIIVIFLILAFLRWSKRSEPRRTRIFKE